MGIDIKHLKWSEHGRPELMMGNGADRGLAVACLRAQRRQGRLAVVRAPRDRCVGEETATVTKGGGAMRPRSVSTHRQHGLMGADGLCVCVLKVAGQAEQEKGESRCGRRRASAKCVVGGRGPAACDASDHHGDGGRHGCCCTSTATSTSSTCPVCEPPPWLWMWLQGLMCVSGGDGTGSRSRCRNLAQPRTRRTAPVALPRSSSSSCRLRDPSLCTYHLPFAPFSLFFTTHPSFHPSQRTACK